MPATTEGAASAAELLAARVPDAHVVAALHSVSSVTLGRLDTALEDDVLVCGDDESAVAAAVTAIGRLGVRPVTVGPLRLAATLEALTAVLLSVNRRHAVHAGLRLTGLDG
jgi:predicted dinucleotide-binding enzyme